jgi:transposase
VGDKMKMQYDKRIKTIDDTKQATLKSITLSYYCKKLKKKFKRVVDEHDFSFSESSCEMCGSHGNLQVEIECPCGKKHEFEIQGW